jgi:pimeloyl-ACP methyl ester carboxylesterase
VPEGASATVVGSTVADDGTKLFVRRREGPRSAKLTALLSDGIACDGFIWKYLWDALAEHVHVAHWNYRGHGRSAPPADPEQIGVEHHARDLDAVRRFLGDPQVVLFGHSFGCQVALEATRLRQQGVAGLALLCGASGRVTHTFKGSDVLAQVLPRIIAAVEAHPHIARALWNRVPAEAAMKIAALTGEIDPKLMDPRDLLPYLTHMVDIDLPMFLKMLRLAGEHSAADFLPEIQAPVLVVGSDRDSFTPVVEAERMAAAIPHCDLMLVSGTHVAPIEQREAVEARVIQFLEGPCAEYARAATTSAPEIDRSSRVSS